MHIPIVPESVMCEVPKPPDAGLLFAWNYYEEIVPKLQARGFTGQVLVP